MMDLGELIARVEKLTGPDIDLDKKIYDTLFPSAVTFHTAGYPHYTASLDAAVALCERVLPGWSWTINSDGSASVYQGSGHFEQAATPAIALVLATLRALGRKP